MKNARRPWRFSNDESGQALMLGAICMASVMGVMALAVDVGYMHYRQVQLQTAADSAAIAAGLENGNCGQTVCANMKTAAEQALIEDGIVPSGTTITPTTGSSSSCTAPTSTGLAMMINVAPCMLGASDPNNGNTNMTEVVLTEPQSTFFGKFFGIGTFNLVARSEAGLAYINKPSYGFCVWTGSASINGNAVIDLTNCGWYDHGNLSPNSGDNVTATNFQYYGTWESPDNCGQPSNPTCTWHLGDSETEPAATTANLSDPLAGTQAPSKPNTEDANNCSISNLDCWGNNVTSGKAVALPPGYYGGGINTNGTSVTLSPGLYYFNGTFNVDSATVTCPTCTGGAGVTLYFASGTLQMNSGSTITLNAPSTGDLTTSNGGTDVANILVWQSSTNSSGMDIDANSTSTLNGIIWLPDAELTVNSGPNMTATALDVQSILVDGNFTITGNNLLGAGSPSSTLGTFALAE
jgi:Putative Flp pilus-assembly TadE/G-like